MSHELIKINFSVIGGSQVNSVNAKDLHEGLGIKTDFRKWVERKIANNVFLEEEKDYILLDGTVQVGKGGHNKKDYALTLDAAKKIAMVEDSARGNAIREYFLEMERIAKDKAEAKPYKKPTHGPQITKKEADKFCPTDFEDEDNPITMFIEENVYVYTGDKRSFETDPKEIYQAFEMWIADHGDPAISQKLFMQALKTVTGEEPELINGKKRYKRLCLN